MRLNKFVPSLGYEILGGLKIKDGLFLGDQYAAQDLEFIITNKITHIINCSGKQIANHWISLGITYLTYNWLDIETQIIFDSKDEVLNQSYKFIEETLNKGESILVQSVKGHNRSVCIIAAYLMKKFRWTLYKTLEYLHSRRPDLEMNANFFNQLMNLETRLSKLGFAPKTYNWEEIGDDKNNFDSEELLIRNTYLNSKNIGVAEFKDIPDKYVTQKIMWIDNNSNDKSRLTTVFIPKYDEIDFGRREKLLKSKKTSINSILKGSHKRVINLNTEKKEQKKISIIKSPSIDKFENPKKEEKINLEEEIQSFNQKEEKKQKTTILIKKNNDQKYLSSLKNTNIKTMMIKQNPVMIRYESQKEINVNNDPMINKNNFFSQNQIPSFHDLTENNEKNSLKNKLNINEEHKKLINNLFFENDNKNVSQPSNSSIINPKLYKIKSSEPQTIGKKELLYMTYENKNNNPLRNSMKIENQINQAELDEKAQINQIKKHRKSRKKHHIKKEGENLIENSLKYSQKIYGTTNYSRPTQYNNFFFSNSSSTSKSKNYSIVNGKFSLKNYNGVEEINAEDDKYNKNLNHRPSTAPPKKDKEIVYEKNISNEIQETYDLRDNQKLVKYENVRQNSAQPSRNEQENKLKNQFRMTSPSPGPYTNLIFQSPIYFGLKPKWKI